MIDTPYIYFTAPEMDAFIEQTSRDLNAIYTFLWHDHRDVTFLHTATLLLVDSH
jgi:hypothetical protein